jgi:thioredoxin-like negative regulator of GroEL
MTTTLQNHEAFEAALESGTFVVWFSASWCMPCKRMDAGALQTAATAAGLRMFVCDVGRNPRTAGECDVRSVPTFIVFANGREVRRITNADTASVCGFLRKP